MKEETEGLIIAACYLSLQTKNYQANIIKKRISLIMCEQKTKSNYHYYFLTLIEYKQRHVKIGPHTYWKIAKCYGISKSEISYKQQPELITEAKETTILSDFAIQTDWKIKNDRPKTVSKNIEEKKTYLLINISVPANKNMSDKEHNKLNNYEDLKIEIEKICHLKTTTVPLIEVALGMIKEWTDKYINKIPESLRL